MKNGNLSHLIPDLVVQYLSQITSLPLTFVERVSGGDINQAAILSLQDKTKIFVKWSEHALPDFYECERDGLERLRGVSKYFSVPVVLGCFDSVSLSALFLEYLGEPAAPQERELALGLADLHRVTAPQFGLERDNYIGLSPQLNGWSSAWSDFFVEKRLFPQLRQGRNLGWISNSDCAAFERAFEVIHGELCEYEETPSLLHGDLWNGNVFWGARTPVLIDPASYFGNREADIAMTELFGGFGTHFYSTYAEAHPLQDGYERRKISLNLYHFMNHANLFGGSYTGEVFRLIRRFS
ncbi:MAG: fructosamine kinase family protein [Bdellovibrionales bacterium]|nr:fructosamine kinase family protein [Bdellovibrionales bacterium]